MRRRQQAFRGDQAPEDAVIEFPKGLIGLGGRRSR